MKKFCLFIAVITALSAPAYAERAAMQQPSDCAMRDSVSVSVTLNMRADNYSDAKKKLDDKLKQISEFAKQQNFKKFDIQSMNYNINAQNNNNITDYMLSGSANYWIDSPDNAFKFAEFLKQQNLQAGVNVSSYRDSMCVSTDSERDKGNILSTLKKEKD